MPKIMPVENMAARVDEVVALMVDAFPGVCIHHGVEALPDGQPNAYVWPDGGKDGVAITSVGADRVVCSVIPGLFGVRQTFVSPSDAVQAALAPSAPARAIAA